MRARLAALIVFTMLVLTGCAGIYGGMLGAVIQSTTKDETCYAPGGPGTATGSENLERSFNYFVSAGYSKEMAAGIAGNLQTESAGATPWLAEWGYESQWGWGVPDNQLRGWGIAQWTWGRHAQVRDYVTNKLGRNFYTSQYSSPKAEDWLTPDDENKMLQAQLEFLQKELEGPGYRNSTYLPMVQASTPEVAADIFVRNFEVPANVDATSLVRQAQARALYDKYASGSSTPAPSPGTGTTPTTPPSDGSNSSTLQWSFPLVPPAVQTSPYGPRLHPILGFMRLHAGLDLVPSGSDWTVRSVSSGVVTYAAYSSGTGNMVGVLLDNGDGVRYLHLDSMAVGVGDRVAAGDKIGMMGNTGYSTGAHLHFTVIPKDKVRSGEPMLGFDFTDTNNDPPRGLNGNTDTTDPALWLDSKGFNVDGSPNGKIPDDQYAPPGDGLNGECAPDRGGTPGTPGMDMNPGPIPGFSQSALDSSPYRRTDNETQYVGKMNSYILSVWQEVSPSDVFDYPSSPPSCHAGGNALDLMVPVDSQLGDTIAAWYVAYATEMKVSVLIWKQQIWTAARPAWRPMEDRGSITQNHRDHVHISFSPCVG